MNSRLEKYILLLTMLILLIPYFLFYPNIFTNLHDNLEIDVIRNLLLVRNGAFFKPNDYIIPEMMCGLPRSSYDSEFYYSLWLYYFFSPYMAYTINIVFIHFVAFFGMYLLTNYVLKDKIHSIGGYTFALIISATFCYLQENHLINLGLSIAASPLLLWALLNLYHHNKKWYYYLILCSVPLFVRFTHVGFFWIVVLLLFNAYLILIKKQFNKYLLISMGILIFMFSIVEYRLIQIFLFSDYISHRVEFNQQVLLFKGVLRNFIKSILFGHYQAKHIGWVLLVLVIIFYRKMTVNDKMILMFILIFHFIGNLYNYKGITKIIHSINFLREFDMSRFLFIMPVFIFYLILRIYAKASNTLFKNIFILSITLTGFGYATFYNHTVKDAVKRVFHFGKKEINSTDFFYLNEFYATDIFDQIKKDIKLPVHTFRVGSIGIHPALSLFNGFYSIDGAIANYPLTYKKQFRKIIAKELNKSEKLKRYFDEYGCRAYLFLSEIEDDKDCVKKCKESVKHCELNTQELKKMNCKYIFSSAEIKNITELKWRLFNIYENTVYKIYVYEIL